MDLSKPLVTGLWSPRQGRDPVWIKERYERLQNLCFVFEKLGHDLRSCPVASDKENHVEAVYGNGLGCRELGKLMKILLCKEGWEEVEGRYKTFLQKSFCQLNEKKVDMEDRRCNSLIIKGRKKEVGDGINEKRSDCNEKNVSKKVDKVAVDDVVVEKVNNNEGEVKGQVVGGSLLGRV